MNLKNWKLEREADANGGIAWAILDTANSSTNTLGAEVMTELGLILDECEQAEHGEWYGPGRGPRVPDTLAA